MLARYVMGGLSDREREQLEEEYFEDDEAFEQMLIAEEDLIDAYARGELSAEERARVEEHVLATPQGRERVQFARALAGAVSDARRAESASNAADVSGPGLWATLFGRRAVLRLALAAVALVAVVSLVWFLYQRARTRDESQPVRAELTPTPEQTQEVKPPATPEQAQAPTPSEDEAPREGNSAPQNQTPPGKSNQQVPRPSVASFVLTPGLVRGGGGATLQVPRDASSIVLWLNVEAVTYPSYRAVIETADGRRVWNADLEKPRRRGGETAVIKLPPVPGRDLPPGDYILLLSGQRPDGSFEGVADYSFRIVRK